MFIIMRYHNDLEVLEDKGVKFSLTFRISININSLKIWVREMHNARNARYMQK